MIQTPKISIFEHETLKVGRTFTDSRTGKSYKFKEEYLVALKLFHGEKCVFYTLIHNGVKFCEYVGVLHIGNLIVEILPKADRDGKNENDWRKILVGMLKSVGAFKTSAPSSALLSLKSDFLLDLYFSLFLNEVEYLMHQGLIKKYRKQESNRNALTGSLKFAQHIRKNLVHKERFYLKHTVYDREHELHRILYKTLQLLQRINTNVQLNSRIGSILLRFPEMPDIAVSDAVFDKISLNRKSEPYKTALDIARLLLLNYHPDLNNGRQNVLALLFNMNYLWEKFVYISLRKKLPSDQTITEQTKRNFWEPEKGYTSFMKPDIVINKDRKGTIVIDTKWKNIGNNNPSPNDLRQLYVYLEYYNANKVALLYPDKTDSTNKGLYTKRYEKEREKECAVLKIAPNKQIDSWQTEIYKLVDEWINPPKKITNST